MKFAADGAGVEGFYLWWVLGEELEMWPYSELVIICVSSVSRVTIILLLPVHCMLVELNCMHVGRVLCNN